MNYPLKTQEVLEEWHAQASCLNDQDFRGAIFEFLLTIRKLSYETPDLKATVDKMISNFIGR